MAQTGTLENHFYMLALMFKSTLQKQNEKFSLLERILLQSHSKLFPAETCFPCLDLSSLPSVMRAWAVLCCWQQSHSPGLLLTLSLSPYTFIYSLHMSLAMWLFALFRGSCATTCSYWQAKLAKCFSEAWGWLTGKKTTKHKHIVTFTSPEQWSAASEAFVRQVACQSPGRGCANPGSFEWLKKTRTIPFAALLVSYLP